MAFKRRKIFIMLALLAMFIQLIPTNRSNPPVTAELAATQELQDILVRSCYDCHSNETVWPWYSRVAPVSWLVAIDVHEGRGHLNFSTWGEYSREKQAKLRKEIRKAVLEGEMPPVQYLPVHPQAHLSKQDKAVILAWVAASPGQ